MSTLKHTTLQSTSCTCGEKCLISHPVTSDPNKADPIKNGIGKTKVESKRLASLRRFITSRPIKRIAENSVDFNPLTVEYKERVLKRLRQYADNDVKILDKKAKLDREVILQTKNNTQH